MIYFVFSGVPISVFDADIESVEISDVSRSAKKIDPNNEFSS